VALHLTVSNSPRKRNLLPDAGSGTFTRLLEEAKKSHDKYLAFFFRQKMTLCFPAETQAPDVPRFPSGQHLFVPNFVLILAPLASRHIVAGRARGNRRTQCASIYNRKLERSSFVSWGTLCGSVSLREKRLRQRIFGRIWGEARSCTRRSSASIGASCCGGICERKRTRPSGLQPERPGATSRCGSWREPGKQT
jgi:hypothetical protein